MLSDTARAASYFVRLQSHPLTSLAISSVTLRFGLLLLLELPKRSHTTDQEEREQSNEQTATGFWSRSFNLWLYSTFSLGFRKIISIEDLGSLGPEFSSQRLSEQLALALNESEHCCPQSFYFPRICTHSCRQIVALLLDKSVCPHILWRLVPCCHSTIMLCGLRILSTHILTAGYNLCWAGRQLQAYHCRSACRMRGCILRNCCQ